MKTGGVEKKGKRETVKTGRGLEFHGKILPRKTATIREKKEMVME